MDYWEIFTLVTGLAYVVLEVRQKNAMWILGILTAFASMIVFFRQGLYAFFGLQVYYFLISFWGLYRWEMDRRAMEKFRTEEYALSEREDCGAMIQESDRTAGEIVGKSLAEDGKNTDVIRLNRMTWQTALVSTVVAVAAFAGVAMIMKSLDDPQPWLDSAVTVLGAVATWWLGRSYAEQWWLLIVANILSVLMFILQGSWWMTALYVVYVAASAYGLMHWHRAGVYM